MKKTLIIILIVIILTGVGYFVGKKSSDNNALKNDTLTNDSNTETNAENSYIPIQNNKAKDVDKVEVQNDPIQDTVNTKITTTYMCDNKVKIIEEQDSPSLPPRISYLRVRDNMQVAYYGDFGAYVRPEYFSIDRAQIEQGYSFNETNFCKYLKK
jgi:hypothetical protein